MQHRFAKLALYSVIGMALMALLTCTAFAQGDTALLRGTVMDSSGALIPHAKVTLTNDATNVPEKVETDAAGRYIFSALKPASYKATVEAAGFKTSVQPNIVLRVGQQSDLVFRLEVGQLTESVEITAEAPIMNTVSGALGTEVTNKYISDMPLMDRNITSLAFLAPGVTETQGGKAGDFGGTMFSSNGQRYASAEFRLDGGVASHPEGGEGGTTYVGYLPSVEAIQEFKVQNNSFSAEYGSNGGTVISMVTKSGSNALHGSGWYFFRRPGLDANDFFSNMKGAPKGDYAHDQYGAALGGPIKKDKTFFFVDYEHTRHNVPFTYTTTVPTDAQKAGDFSKTFGLDVDGNPFLQTIFNPCSNVHSSAADLTGSAPCSVAPVRDASGAITDYQRAPFANNTIPGTLIDPVMKKVMALYPAATDAGERFTGANNYTKKMVDSTLSYKLDVKLDHYLTGNSRVSGRYSRSRPTENTPNDFLSNNDNSFNDDSVTIEHIWTPLPTLVWSNRATMTRYINLQLVQMTADPSAYGFPDTLVLNPAYHRKDFPSISFDGYQGFVTDVGSTITTEADTQYSYSSLLTKITGAHNLRFGGEYRAYMNNFFQPGSTAGTLGFSAGSTAQSVFDPNTDTQGNGLASALLGVIGSGSTHVSPAVANKSSQTAFFVQDDWKVSNKLTINLGLRYEWAVPYSERFNRNQFTCQSCDSGIFVPSLGAFVGREILGTTPLANSDMRHSGVDRNNVAPRLGFAYSPDQKTVIRGGAGVYYGLSYATNWQYAGAAWQNDIVMHPSNDSGVTQYASVENPYPTGFILPSGSIYGGLSNWGYPNYNHAGMQDRLAEIYQWNLGIQRQLPGGIMVEASYSANRSTHLPWKKNPQNANTVPTADRLKYGTAGLNAQVPNPFQFLFTGPDSIFPTSVDSAYNNDTISRLNTLKKFPQFDGYFGDFPPFAASSFYNSLQMRFEKRTSHGLTFNGAYTFSKYMSTSDEGANYWVGRMSQGEPQELTNLSREKSISANDTPHRLALATVYELPIGRGHQVGGHMNRLVDGLIGGWKVNSFLTLQSGQPLHVGMGTNRITGGAQRPNLNGDPRSSYSAQDVVDGLGNYFNVAAFSAPPDQTPGTATRYLSNARLPGIRNIDLGIAKNFTIKEGKFVEVRGEFFNATNTVRFSPPGNSFGKSSFGLISGQANSSRHGQIGARFVF
jgi:hypothetical protein